MTTKKRTINKLFYYGKEIDSYRFLMYNDVLGKELYRNGEVPATPLIQLFTSDIMPMLERIFTLEVRRNELIDVYLELSTNLANPENEEARKELLKQYGCETKIDFGLIMRDAHQKQEKIIFSTGNTIEETFPELKILKDEPCLLKRLIVEFFDNALEIRQCDAPYRTKSALQENVITTAPERIALITSQHFENSINFRDWVKGGKAGMYIKNCNGNTTLAKCDPNNPVQFNSETGIFTTTVVINGEAMASSVKLKDLRSGEDIKNIDTTFLRVVYTMIKEKVEKCINNNEPIPQTFDLYIRSIAKATKIHHDLIVDKIKSYDNVMGFITDSYNRASSYKVLAFIGHSEEMGTVKIGAHYLVELAKAISNEQQTEQKALEEATKTKKKHKPLPPTHSYLIDTSIASERDKIAVENVNIIVNLIVKAGTQKGIGSPNITVRELINRNPLFKEDMQSAKNKNTALKRHLTKTWKLLRTKTDLEKVYKDIIIPDDDYFVTPKELDTCIMFPHRGPRNKKELAECELTKQEKIKNIKKK